MTILEELITNTYTKRKSSMRAAYLIIIALAAIVVFACVVVMIVDVFKEGRITVDYFTGISQIILAAASLILAAGVPKSLSDKFQNRKKEFKKEDLKEPKN